MRRRPPHPTLRPKTLQVLREDRVSQAEVNRLWLHAWAEIPEELQRLVGEEEIVAPHHRDGTYYRASTHVEAWIREEAFPGPDAPSHLTVVDILFEISRRLRLSTGLGDVQVLGHALVASDAEHLPALITLPIEDPFVIKSSSQEAADRICALTYRENRNLMIALSESQRRRVASYGLQNDVDVEIERHMTDRDPFLRIGYALELGRRLHVICDTHQKSDPFF